MKYTRAKAGFFRYRNDELLVVAANIIRCLEESTIFTNPTPTVAVLKTAYDAYQRAVLEATTGGSIYTAARRETKRTLANLLQRLAQYINDVSDGNLSKLRSSGFPVLAKKKKGESPDTPGSTFLADGRLSGEVAFSFTPVGRDMLYEYCFATKINASNEPLWDEIDITSRSFKAYKKGFIPGTTVYFKVRARNKHGCSDWTAPVKMIAR